MATCSARLRLVARTPTIGFSNNQEHRHRRCARTRHCSVTYDLTSNTFSHGAEPFAGLIADANGDLFGTTHNGGDGDYGTVFEIKNAGTVAAPVYASAPTTLVTFNSSNGAGPAWGGPGLTADANGNLFGTTVGGGGNNDGTVFDRERWHDLSTHHSKPAPCSRSPAPTAPTGQIDLHGRLIAEANGDLFGTIANGGAERR